MAVEPPKHKNPRQLLLLALVFGIASSYVAGSSLHLGWDLAKHFEKTQYPSGGMAFSFNATLITLPLIAGLLYIPFVITFLMYRSAVRVRPKKSALLFGLTLLSGLPFPALVLLMIF